MSLHTPNEERQARLAPVLGSTSGGQAMARNSRALLVTVLGEFARPNGGSAWTQTLIDAMGLVGVTEKATRQILVRLDERGWLDRSRDGRRTRWHLTDASRQLLDEGAERIYRHGRDERGWDGRWSVLLASVPDGGGDRHGLTVGLKWAGYGPLGHATWISPWVDREVEAARTVGSAGVVGATSFVAEIGALGDGADLAARAWDLEAIASTYREFTRWLHDRDGDEPTVALRSLTETVHRWRRFPLVDPQLPYELLPDDWPGADAANAFAEARTRWRAGADDWWLDREARYGPH
ncbi:MAG: PaaX family transcriptional regulator C-terminal domain-containing protein [Actinomycetota bacterium]